MSKEYLLLRIVPWPGNLSWTGNADSETSIQVLNVAQPSGKFWVGTSTYSDYPAVILTSTLRAELQQPVTIMTLLVMFQTSLASNTFDMRPQVVLFVAPLSFWVA